jgi:hypothetical protein
MSLVIFLAFALCSAHIPVADVVQSVAKNGQCLRDLQQLGFVHEFSVISRKQCHQQIDNQSYITILSMNSQKVTIGNSKILTEQQTIESDFDNPSPMMIGFREYGQRRYLRQGR